MKNKINFTAIIAVAMIAMSVLVLGSCNADDDDYNFEYGTLAKGVMTRSGIERGIYEYNYSENVRFTSNNAEPMAFLDGLLTFKVQFSLGDQNNCKISNINFSADKEFELEVKQQKVYPALYGNCVSGSIILDAQETITYPSIENPDSIIEDTIYYNYSDGLRIPFSSFTKI